MRNTLSAAHYAEIVAFAARISRLLSPFTDSQPPLTAI